MFLVGIAGLAGNGISIWTFSRQRVHRIFHNLLLVLAIFDIVSTDRSSAGDENCGLQDPFAFRMNHAIFVAKKMPVGNSARVHIRKFVKKNSAERLLSLFYHHYY